MQHANAHADDEPDHGPATSIDHLLVSRKPGELIDTPEKLSEFLDHLRTQKIFAYDSEFIGELTYHPRLCVIQAATTQRIGLIDPLVGLDLIPFWELLTDPTLTKIVHAGEQDVEPVYRLTGKAAANIFDTQVAAGFCRLAYPVGLAKLVLELVGAKLSKGLTFTHWDQRPLSNQQLRYAADDVRFLPAIHAELSARLEAAGHLAAAGDEFQTLCDPARYTFNPDTAFWRIRGAAALAPANLAVLRKLVTWRNDAAKMHDVPPRALIKDDLLLEMARHPVKNLDKLSQVRGLPRPIQTEHGQEIVDLVNAALAEPAERRPVSTPVELTPSERFSSEAFYAAAMVVAASQGVDPALVASRQEVSDLFRALVEKRSLGDISLLSGWRRKLVGQRLLDLFNCQFELRFNCEDSQLRMVE